MKNLDRLLATQRELERHFAAGVTDDDEVDGWSAALLFFHIAQWRGRLVAALSGAAEERTYSPPSGNIDEFNDAELPAGRGVSLVDAAGRSDAALGSLIRLWELLGERAFYWYAAETSSEALVRNSYLHPRIHLASHLTDRGKREEGDGIVEATATELRAADAAPRVLGAALYTLAVVRVTQGRSDEALSLLEETAPMRRDLSSNAIDDRAFEALRGSARFRVLGGPETGGQSR